MYSLYKHKDGTIVVVKSVGSTYVVYQIINEKDSPKYRLRWKKFKELFTKIGEVDYII